MKKISILILVFSIVLPAILFAGGDSEKAAKEIKFQWKMNFYAMNPDEEPGAKKVFELALPAIKERTKGNLEITAYWGEELGVKATNYPQALMKNVVQLVWTFPGYYDSELPVQNCNALPFLISTEKEYKKFSQEIYWKYFNQAVERAYKGEITAVAGQPYNWSALATTKAAPSNYNMKGLKIRSPSPDGAKIYDLLGGTGVVISWAEMMPALQQHTIDGVETAFSSLTSGKFYEICKHVYLMNSIMSESCILASTDALNSLPKAYRDILFEEFKEASEAVYADLIPVNKGQQEALQLWIDNGATIHQYSAQDVAEVRKKIKPIWDKQYNKDDLSKACMDEYYKVFGNPFK